MFCPSCKSGMTPMIVSWFCPNDCDRKGPNKTSKSYKIHTRLGEGLVVTHSSAIPEQSRYYKWWREGQTELDESEFPYAKGNLSFKDTKHVWKDIDSQGYFILRTAMNMKILGVIFVI